MRGRPSSWLWLAAMAVAACRSGDSAPPDQASQAAESASEAPAAVEQALAAIVATAAEAHGTVEVRRKGEVAWGAVGVGTTFRAGDWIRTKEHSSVRVRVHGGGGELTLGASTDMIVDTSAVPAAGADQVAATVVSIQHGTASGVVSKQAGAATAASLSVRAQDGSEVTLSPSSEGAVAFRLTPGKDALEVAVAEGELTVAGGNESRAVSAGHAADVQKGAVQRLREMIGFPSSKTPGIDARYQFEEGMEIPLSWGRVKQASGYRVQVARDLSFADVVDEVVVDQRSFAFAPPAAGDYAWRVASMDRDGNFGEYGFSRRLYCELEPPHDLLLAPPDLAKVAYDRHTPRIEFAWQSSGSAASYQLVVARAETLQQSVVLKKTLTSQSVVIESLRAGDYFWGVFTADRARKPLFLSPRRLTIQKRNAPRVKDEDLWND